MLSATTTTKLIRHLFVMIIIITTATARPQNTMPADSQDIAEYQPNYSELRNLEMYPQQPMIIDSAPLERIQMLMGQSKGYGGLNSLYRLPESKRQVRYRQCYFNPISCFRK